MPEISIPVTLTLCSMCMCLISMVSLLNAKQGLQDFLYNLASITMIGSVMKLSNLIQWWTILAFMLTVLLTGIIWRAAYQSGESAKSKLATLSCYMTPIASFLTVSALIISE